MLILILAREIFFKLEDKAALLTYTTDKPFFGNGQAVLWVKFD
jgi:hypothetical protein